MLDRERRAELIPRRHRTSLSLEGVDLAMSLTDHPDGEASVRGARGELRFMPGGELTDLRGERWSVEGEHALLGLEVRDGTLIAPAYPDALGRIWSALRCPGSGEVLLSARPGHEFVDWGRAHHIGGGSHGSLHANDSLRLAAVVRHRARRADAKPQWTLRDVVPMIASTSAVGGRGRGRASPPASLVARLVAAAPRRRRPGPTGGVAGARRRPRATARRRSPRRAVSRTAARATGRAARAKRRDPVRGSCRRGRGRREG